MPNIPSSPLSREWERARVRVNAAAIRESPLGAVPHSRDAVVFYVKEARIMQRALHVRTTVLPGGKIEIVDRELPVGESVDVVVSQSAASSRRPIMEILNSGPERRLFQTAEEVRAYLAEERASWDR